MAHLERQFVRGMSWGNYGAVWEIDHILPKAMFAITAHTDPDFRACWGLPNLRPLFVAENASKKHRRTNLI